MSSSFQTRLGNSPEEGVKAPCKASSDVDIVLSGLQTIDTVALVEGDRCLVRSQTNATENGIYTVSSGTWLRSKDFNQGNDVVDGVLIIDANKSTLYEVDFTGDYEPDVTIINLSIISISPTEVTDLVNSLIQIVTISTSAPSGGNDGDIWYQV